MGNTHSSSTEKSQPINHGKLFVASSNYGLPIIPLPEVLEFNRHGWPAFTIPTEDGGVSIEALYSRFCATGNVASLQRLGFVQVEWLPGMPGCGKVSQTVGFDANGPRLVFEKGRRPKINSIRITRKSKTLYLVEIPATEHQATILEKAIRERRDQTDLESLKRKEVERERFEEERRAEEYKTPEKFRSYIAEFAIRNPLLEYYLEDACDYYRFSDETMKRIQDGMREVSKAIADGVVIPGKKSRHIEENVIFIGKR